MVNIWEEDYIGNPNNRFYLTITRCLGLDVKENWKQCRDMYLSLDNEVREEFYSFIWEVESMNIHKETQEYIALLKRVENKPSTNKYQITTAA